MGEVCLGESARERLQQEDGTVEYSVTYVRMSGFGMGEGSVLNSGRSRCEKDVGAR